MTGAPMTAEELIGGMRNVIETSDDDAVAMIFMGNPTGKNIICPVVEHPQLTLLMLIMAVEAGELPKPDWLCLVSDTYSWQGDAFPDAPLQEEFQKGNPSVTEAIMGICMAPDGPSYQVMQPYVRTGGEIIWGQVQQMADGRDGEEVSGALPPLIARVLSAVPQRAFVPPDTNGHDPDRRN